jgi:hypothetical protein
MGIRIIQENEKLTFSFESAKIFYKRIPRFLYSKWVRESTNRRGDRTDWTAVGRLAMEFSIIGWEGFEDKEGKMLEYSPDLIDYIPGAVIDEFTSTLLEGFAPKDDTATEGRRKNS